jgi:hypothetical protein
MILDKSALAVAVYYKKLLISLGNLKSPGLMYYRNSVIRPDFRETLSPFYPKIYFLIFSSFSYMCRYEIK